jgi:hypothetical protein
LLPTSAANKTNRVIATQRVTVLIKSIRRSDFIQNERTKSQSPAEPIAEPVIRTKSNRRVKDVVTGIHTEPHHPIMGVKTLQRMVRTIKPNALRVDIAVRSLRETTIADA